MRAANYSDHRAFKQGTRLTPGGAAHESFASQPEADFWQTPEPKLARLEGQLLSDEIDRRAFLDRAVQLGLSEAHADAEAGKFLAIAIGGVT
jgi:hypothetical protein